ncbi:hypothetical protein C8R46DRAFT_1042765 [Mycena filopes]|nr:hypothetical protein C8R46DRAFT_1042765 [Mycena filopes]
MDARAPPFSLLEFGNLVSAALASPDIPPLASALPVSRESTTAPTAHTAHTTRRSLLSRVKHALVSLRTPPTTNPRRAASEPARAPPHRRARSPAYRIPELQRLSSFNAFDTTNPKDASAFEPNVPLVMQYERVYGLSVPSLPSYSLRTSTSSPPSSTSSCTSSGSSYPPTPLTLTPVSEAFSEDVCTSRWSLSSSSTCSDAEPVFLTKPNSSNSRPAPTPTPTLRRCRTRLSLGLRLRLHLLPPAKPVPACPLPPLPAYASSRHTSTPPTPTVYANQRVSRHTFSASPAPTAHADQHAPSRSLRSVRSLHSLRVCHSPLHDEETRSLTTRARPSARSGRRAPVPSLLEAFPVPPNSVPSSPYSSPAKSSKSASSSPSKRPRSPFPFTRPIPISIPGAYPPSPPRSSAFGDYDEGYDDDFDAQDDGDDLEQGGEEEKGTEGNGGEEVEEDVFHSACSDAL